ncbi:mitochondrial carrier domain-containing protein [Chaetomium sp. MPI-SDFR-AT-0129]|nr:mitochondrial carrier domain-containing protein [Chaetomium sp. MPI-SDFR-AT-0129]
MANHHHDGVNPLRPYYIPPSIGEPAEAVPTPGPRAFAQPNVVNSSDRYASKARDIFSDLDYKDYIADPSPSVVQTVKEVLDELLWKYSSVLMAQPFEVAKTIMQVRAQDDLGGLEATAEAAEEARQRKANQRIHMFDEATQNDSDSDLDDEASFFTSHEPGAPGSAMPRSKNPWREQRETPQAAHPAGKPLSPHHLAIRTPDSVLEVIAQLWNKEGAWGVWKGTNATFIYSVLQSLLENWSRSLLSALFNVPDLGVRHDLDRLVDIASPYPWASLFVAATAAVVTSLVLSPLDLVRTRLVITSTHSATRRTLSTMRSLPSYLCHSSLIVPTVLHSLIHPLLTLSTPLVLRTRFMIDRELAPTAFSVAKFCSSTVALLLKLPLETVLRRGQVAVLSSEQYVSALEGNSAAAARAARARRANAGAVVAVGEHHPPPPAPEGGLETIVPVGRFNGVFGTMYRIVNDEGSHAITKLTTASKTPRKGRSGSATPPASVSETVYRRGQGMDGLWRGWKVSWWGLVGLWAAGVLGGGGDGEF